MSQMGIEPKITAHIMYRVDGNSPIVDLGEKSVVYDEFGNMIIKED